MVSFGSSFTYTRIISVCGLRSAFDAGKVLQPPKGDVVLQLLRLNIVSKGLNERTQCLVPILESGCKLGESVFRMVRRASVKE